MDSAGGPPRTHLNEVGDVVLDDVRQIRALAAPVALAAFTWLQRHGPASVGLLSVELHEPEDAVAGSLAVLESAGLASCEDGTWRAPGSGLFLQLPEDDPAATAAARQLSNVMLLAVEHLPREWVAATEPDLPDAWARAAGLFNAGVALTPAELDAVQVELERVLEPYLTREPADVPPDARTVRLLAYFLPGPA